MAAPREVGRPADDACTAQTRRSRHHRVKAALPTSHHPSPPHSASTVHPSSVSTAADAATCPASQLSSLRRLSACTVSLPRKPASDTLQLPGRARNCRLLTEHDSDEQRSSQHSASSESEYHLSDDSSLSASPAQPRKPRRVSTRSAAASSVRAAEEFIVSEDESSSSTDSDDEIARDRQRQLHRRRQARYAMKKRLERNRAQSAATHSPSLSKVTPVVASIAAPPTKRRLSSSAHLSPAMLPVVKAQLVDRLPQQQSAVAATVVEVHEHSPLLHATQLTAPFMSPLTLGLPAPVVIASAAPSLLSGGSLALSSAGGADSVEPFLSVSVDVFYVVLSFLHPMDLLSLCTVSAAACRSVSDPSIWRPLVHRPWPITCDHTHDWKRVYCTRIKRALAGARYLCTFCACTRTFKQDGLLEAHTAQHSRQHSVYPCTVAGCGLSFDTARRLQYHVKRHSGSGALARRAHACDWPGCTLSFPTPYALSLHRCRHTGEKRPHSCKQPGCTRSFNSRHALTLHAHTHQPASERTAAFPCSVDGCGRLFMTRSGLGKHGVKEHGGQVRLVCGVAGCGKLFYYKSELRKHVRQKHKQVGPRVEDAEVGVAGAETSEDSAALEA